MHAEDRSPLDRAELDRQELAWLRDPSSNIACLLLAERAPHSATRPLRAAREQDCTRRWHARRID